MARMSDQAKQVIKRKPGRRLLIKLGKHILRAVGRFQVRHSLCSVDPVLGTADFPWMAQLEESWQEIRQELDQVLEDPGEIPTFHQISPDQARISKGNNWKTALGMGPPASIVSLVPGLFLLPRIPVRK